MRIKGKEKKTPGVNITVSPQAHALVEERARKAKPRRTLRQQVNADYKIPLDA